VVREMVEESRTVQALVQQTQSRLQHEHSIADGLTQRVNELEGEMRRLSDEVSTDQLTQISNRRGLLQAFEAERARLERSGTNLSVGLLDIDNFKRLNDELGHGAGDEALKALAAVVTKTLRPTDHVARYGGEEFVVLLLDTGPEEGLATARKLQRLVETLPIPRAHTQPGGRLTVSVGVAFYPRDASDARTLIDHADEALYRSKEQGRNRVTAWAAA